MINYKYDNSQSLTNKTPHSGNQILQFTDDMISLNELIQRLNVQAETVEKYIRDRKIVPDSIMNTAESGKMYYFYPSRIKEYCEAFGWHEITVDNRKQHFIEFCCTMTMSYSYKPVFLMAVISNLDDNGEAQLSDVSNTFASYYDNRKQRGLPIEKKNCIFMHDEYSQKEVQLLIIKNPFKRFKDMGFMHYDTKSDKIKIDEIIMNNLNEEDISMIWAFCDEALHRYWGE